MISADLYSRLVGYSRKCCEQWGIPDLYMDVAHDIICEGEVNGEDLSRIFQKHKAQTLNYKASQSNIVFIDHKGVDSNYRPMMVYKQCVNPECKDILPEHEFYSATGKSTRSICKKCSNKKDEGRKREPKTRDRGNYTKLFMTKDRKFLSDSYIKDILKKNGVDKEKISPAMIDEKRISIEAKRKRSKNKVHL